MGDGQTDRVVVAHCRAPILRMLRVNLRADGLSVRTASTVEGCLAAIDGHVSALILDADLLRDDVPYSSALLEHLRGADVPLLIVSFEPADRAIARSIKGARFLNRTDNIDEVLRLVHRMLGDSARTAVTTSTG